MMNWISQETKEIKLKTTIVKEYYNTDQYIQQVVCLARDAADHRMFRMVRSLQQEYEKNKT